MLSAFNWSMWREEVGLFTRPVAFHDIFGPVPPCRQQGRGIKCVYVWRDLSLTDGWGWPLRSCGSRAALWWFICCFRSLNQKQWDTVFTVSAWQQSLCLLLTEWQATQDLFPLSLAGRCGRLSGKSINFGNFLLCYFTLFWWLGFWFNSVPS